MKAASNQIKSNPFSSPPRSFIAQFGGVVEEASQTLEGYCKTSLSCEYGEVARRFWGTRVCWRHSLSERNEHDRSRQRDFTEGNHDALGRTVGKTRLYSIIPVCDWLHLIQLSMPELLFCWELFPDFLCKHAVRTNPHHLTWWLFSGFLSVFRSGKISTGIQKSGHAYSFLLRPFPTY